ncbi:HupE/UreJ family protein [Geminicoccus harenae]|uniref:HupE/UreJ family protein n=1 Tax=Geminicoccus harenae TaxID=2498453 RepID=UPI00168B05AC|nr:HupE/UreJ family protein [Geminicoccus harenae]
MARSPLLVLALLAWGILAGVTSAGAHPMGPSLLEIVEDAPGHAEVRWKTPAAKVPGEAMRPVLPEHCQPVGDPGTEMIGIAVVQRWGIACRGPLEGSLVEVDGIAASKASVVVRIVLADGRVLNGVLTPDQPAFAVPARQSMLDVAQSYLLLGFDHILGGLDHLVFVLGLMLLAGSGRQLIAMVTAFTLGHSVTLSLAALGFVDFPSAPIEILIAVSILFLALELTRNKDRPPTLMRRFPWALTFGFGLLHGLGFAGALAEIGLPADEIPLALLSFNVGIEAGQLVFCGVLFSGYLMARKLLRSSGFRLGKAITAYGIGSLSVLWLLERVTALS